MPKPSQASNIVSHGAIQKVASKHRLRMTMVVVTHEMGFAAHVADQVAFMDAKCFTVFEANW